eukprot:CAMPEP_0202959942 /NCGR_PEP_ID=MMETSP1396-20130829/4142_1 /ASSEMBLY_ACC=CAM_ASM_000872 /TAXON_ID= /ORGANISM="Pseudokeronopsis sp., Strain Brazil" /LENGTH=45 /DNA_ID= /DNA_START= /DNA_END= /DNA_ORIENTATION=
MAKIEVAELEEANDLNESESEEDFDEDSFENFEPGKMEFLLPEEL